jgi:5-methylcytosine-specific restriction endonuclease McrA
MEMRESCGSCGEINGHVVEKNGQDCVYCDGCGRWQYNAPKTETGKKERSVQTCRQEIKPKLRSEIINRANCRCEMCGRRESILHVDHAISIHDGLKAGLTEETINHPDNLLCLCEECNLGKGKETISLHVMVGIVKARQSRRSEGA